MAAPAAPAAGEAGFLVIGLGVLLLWMTLVGTKNGYQYTLGALLVWLAKLTGHVWLVGGKLESAIEGVNHHVLDAIGSGIEATETVMAKWWHGQVWLARLVADTLAEFGADMEHAFQGIVQVQIPSYAGAIAGPIRGDLAGFKKGIRSFLNEELRRFSKGIDSLERDLTREAHRRITGIDELAGTLAARLAHLREQAHAETATLGRYAHGALNRRLTRVETAIGASVLAGAAIAALTRVFPYWRCTNVRNLGRAVCRMDSGWLDALLLGTLVISSSLSVRTFAHACQSIEVEVGDVIRAGIPEVSNLPRLPRDT